MLITKLLPAAAALSWLFIAGSVSAADERSGVNAALLYHNYCSVCHGDNGDGESRASGSLQPPPRDFTSADSRRYLSRERIIHSIGEGRPGTAMVAWKEQLNDVQIAALADYLLTTFIEPQSDERLVQGRDIYQQNCSVCHGDEGRSGQWTDGMMLRPRDFTSERARALSREMMIDAVQNGRFGTPMVSFATQLTATEIEMVVDFIRHEFMAVRPEIDGLSGTYAHGLPAGASAVKPQPVVASPEATAPLAVDTPLANGLHGDMERGGRFYQQNCFTCHGETGHGDGPRAYFINPRPADFTAEPFRQRMNRPALFAAISAGKLGTEMPAWGKVLDEQQIADVAEYVFQQFVHPDAKKKP